MTAASPSPTRTPTVAWRASGPQGASDIARFIAVIPFPPRSDRVIPPGSKRCSAEFVIPRPPAGPTGPNEGLDTFAAMQYRALSQRNMTILTGPARGRIRRSPMSLAKRHALVTGSTSGIGLAIARALAKEGADVVINGFGDKAAIEAERAKIEKEFGVKAFYNGADMSKGPEIDGDDRRRPGQDGIARHSGQQRRHPARRADRRISARQMGRDHRHQPHRAVPRDPRRRSGDEGAEMGPHHQHRLGPLAGRLAVQVGLCGGQARPRRAHQDGGARSSRRSASPPIASRPAMSGRRWSSARSPTR